ncbi:hypothetical protein Tco_1408372 [Tanacetum coccineum]
MQKITSLESELKDTKKTLGTTIITLVGRVKKLEGALKKRKRKLVISDSDDDAETVEKEIDMDSLLALANALLAEQQSSFVTPSKDHDSGEASKGSASEDTSSRMDFSPNAVTPGGITNSFANKDIPVDIFVTLGNMPISTGSGTIPAGVSVPTGSSIFPAGSEQVPPVSTSIDKGKAQLVDEPTPTQERTFKQLEDERLGWEDFDIPAQQKKRRQEVQVAAMHYTDDDWITIMAKIQENEELSRTLIGSNLPEWDFASAMVEMVDRKRRQIAEQKAKARRDRPMSQAKQRDFMRTLVKNQLKETFKKAPDSCFPTLTQSRNSTRHAKRLGTQLPIPSKDVRTSKESKVVEEKVESSERTPRKKKYVARKGLHISKSTIPIETGDPELNKDVSQEKEADGVGLILWGDLRVLVYSPEVDDGNKKYPLTVKLMERMLDYQLEIGHGAVGNELTTAVQLVKFLKKQIADFKA